MRRPRIGTPLLLMLTACAHQEPPPATAPSPAAGPSAVEEAAVESFESAYRAVHSGAWATARAGQYVFQRAGQEAVRVQRAAPGGASRARVALSDAYLTTKLQTQFELDGELSGSDIDVDTSEGMVTLRGRVPSEEAATRAVRAALGTSGVVVVESELRWPRAAASRPIYEKVYQR